jgi:hypothetical protein
MKDKKAYKGMSVRISDDAHKALKVYIANNPKFNIYEYLSVLIIKSTTKKKA